MHTCCALFVCLLVIWVTFDGSHGYQCCTSYTDTFEEYHSSQLCEHYCCWNVDFPSLSHLKVCCDDQWRQVAFTDRDQDSCTTDWISDHIWVPIVMIAIVITLGVLLTWCCCRRCRRNQGVIIQYGLPQSTIIVAQQQNTNVMHAGYDQP
ncbi:hypothetical protein DPMN_116181 [Dreissena polymorpha]|uniref:Uncharacterized protein n=1 Tax=Dreissena polymorpha TaxID=45954 RepID=A0A9D4KML2_DREPO|nr:hypothetical protein DPMN_116181 [Dreissena polymorpha]